MKKEDWEEDYGNHIRKVSLSEGAQQVVEGAVGWWWTEGSKAPNALSLKQFAWGKQPEIEERLLQEMELFLGPRLKDAPAA